MKKSMIILRSIILLLIGALVLAGCSKDASSGKKVIKIGHAPYDYEIPVIEVMKIIAEEQGYEVKVVEGDVGFMFMSLEKGDIDIWPGVWLPAIHESFQEKYGDKYELGSAIFEDAPTGWAVPEYVEADSIEDLVGNEDLVNGELIGFEPGSGMMTVSEEIIEGYGLDIKAVNGTVPSMLTELDYAISQKEPILFLGWRPHSMFSLYDIKMLEDPKGYWDQDSEYWGINFDFEEKAPDMYSLVKNFKMSIEDTEAYLTASEEGEDVEDLAQKWIEENRSDIDAWLEQ